MQIDAEVEQAKVAAAVVEINRGVHLVAIRQDEYAVPPFVGD
jgi:hypothetical protein